MFHLKITPLPTPPTILGNVLKQARLDKGLEISFLASQCCLSLKMIREIEDGGEESFYSQTIKFTAAKKVGKFLGLDESNFIEQ